MSILVHVQADKILLFLQIGRISHYAFYEIKRADTRFRVMYFSINVQLQTI